MAYEPGRISPRLPVLRPTGSRVQRALCHLFGHQIRAAGTWAGCLRCKREWGTR